MSNSEGYVVLKLFQDYKECQIQLDRWVNLACFYPQLFQYSIPSYPISTNTVSATAAHFSTTTILSPLLLFFGGRRGPTAGGRAFSGAVTFVKICQN
jgi:hypothetical protein